MAAGPFFSILQAQIQMSMAETTLPALPAAPEWNEATAAQAPLLANLVASTQPPVPWRHPLRFVGWCVRMLFGLVVVGLLLAVLAAIPGVNLVVLGALLDAESRVARSGRLRDGFPLAALAPRLGTIVAGLRLDRSFNPTVRRRRRRFDIQSAIILFWQRRIFDATCFALRHLSRIAELRLAEHP